MSTSTILVAPPAEQLVNGLMILIPVALFLGVLRDENGPDRRPEIRLRWRGAARL